MKAYQIKIILKNSKPPVWRRCLIPAGITFSQLALILEDIVESERCDGYEYEFYQAGLRVREWREGERQAATYGTTIISALPIRSSTDLADGEAWFTFRPGDRTSSTGLRSRNAFRRRIPLSGDRQGKHGRIHRNAGRRDAEDGEPGAGAAVSDPATASRITGLSKSCGRMLNILTGDLPERAARRIRRIEIIRPAKR